jgi:hypothetical protein
MMRTASTKRALLGLCALGLLALPATASATPVVTLKAAAVPVPINPANPHSATYPGTGDILGAAAAVETEFNISGTEYGGAPSPITQVKLYAPAGFKLHTTGWATCTEATIKEKGPEGCPKKSYASPKGEARGQVSFGETRVHETLSVQAFFAEGGGLLFAAEGSTPASIELISKGSISPGSAAPYGPVFTAEVPLVESVPGALDGSAEFIKVKVGAAYKKGKKLISYATVPSKCPKGGFPVKAEVKFLSGEVVPSEYKAPCPKHKK